jgi:hypothetical protein
MCTVTYIPPSKSNDFILTSNRDEKDFRPTIPPEIYHLNGINTGFPKDTKAGGSWIAANENGRLCCLLNGAFVAHQKQEYHKTSRGKILLEIASSKMEVEKFIKTLQLENVEPFTLVIIEQNNEKISSFSEFVWDGKEKHFRELDIETPYIWSSVTLYNEEHRTMRKEWFSRFLEESERDISPEKVFSFHSGSHSNDNSVNVVMKREGGLKTVSITQVIPQNGKLFMRYVDLIHNLNHVLEV